MYVGVCILKCIFAVVQWCMDVQFQALLFIYWMYTSDKSGIRHGIVCNVCIPSLEELSVNSERKHNYRWHQKQVVHVNCVWSTLDMPSVPHPRFYVTQMPGISLTNTYLDIRSQDGRGTGQVLIDLPEYQMSGIVCWSTMYCIVYKTTVCDMFHKFTRNGIVCKSTMCGTVYKTTICDMFHKSTRNGIVCKSTMYSIVYKSTISSIFYHADFGSAVLFRAYLCHVQ